MLFLNSKRLYEQKRYLHQPLNSCNGCNYPRKKLFNGTNYGSYRTQICLVSCSISTCFIKRKTSYGRHYHKFCSWRATISTILNNATAQYFPVATHAADTKQFKFNITCSKFIRQFGSVFNKKMVKSVIYLLFSYQTGYIMWHYRLMIYIPLRLREYRS